MSLRAIFGTTNVGLVDWLTLGGYVAVGAFALFGVVVGVWASVTM